MLHTFSLIVGWIMFGLGIFAFIGGKRIEGGIVAVVGLLLANIF